MANETVQTFYDGNPYPWYPPFFKYRIQKKIFHHFAKQIDKPIPEKPRLLIIGCGVVAPRTLRESHPEAEIWAMDISHATIEQAKKYCGRKIAASIEWVQGDIEKLDILSKFTEEKFDWIHATGVLMLPNNTLQALQNVRKLLKDDGFVRFLLYSRGARSFIEYARLAFLQQKISTLPDVKRWLKKIPTSHPFYFTLATYPEALKNTGFKDGFLVPSVHLYTLNEWRDFFHAANLKVSFLEQKEYVKGIKEYFPKGLHEQLGKLKLSEKITLMEDLGEWRSDFTGLISAIPEDETKKETANKANIPQTAQSYTIPEGISLPRLHLWQRARSSLKKLSETLTNEEFHAIISNLSERQWIGGLTGLRLRGHFSAWNDEARIKTSSSYFFQELSTILLEDYNKEIWSSQLPNPETWSEEQWIQGLTNWNF
jgi:ubiquinone/menaquinone biosynthesis C-methylase UbiE